MSRPLSSELPHPKILSPGIGCQHHVVTFKKQRTVVMAGVRRILPFVRGIGVHRHDIYGNWLKFQ